MQKDLKQRVGLAKFMLTRPRREVSQEQDNDQSNLINIETTNAAIEQTQTSAERKDEAGADGQESKIEKRKKNEAPNVKVKSHREKLLSNFEWKLQDRTTKIENLIQEMDTNNSELKMAV